MKTSIPVGTPIGLQRYQDWAVRIEIFGPPRTKKNHGKRLQLGDKLASVASDAYVAWNKIAQLYLARFRAAHAGVKLPIGCDVNVSALFYRQTLTGDAVGYYQALADSLQEGGIVVDDKLIVSWDGSRMLKSADNPRVELVLRGLQ